MIRQPICVLLAHVDHGKTSILDKIRESSVANKEAGGITQAITAYSVPLNKIQKISGELLEQLKIKLTIPGILFVDSPGHEAFTTLRKRGGSIADIAILVIDINDGVKPQTIEVIEILKNSKTPFIIAANKIDKISSWRRYEDKLIKNISEQQETVQQDIEKKIYNIVAKLSEYGFNSERFDRVEDYTKQIAIVPTSAKTGEGFPELLMIIVGLAQKYLEKNLKTEVNGPAKGTILEITEEKGMGKVLDVVIYDGSIKVGDEVIIGDLSEPKTSKVKSIFTLENNKLKPVKEAHASKAIVLSLVDSFDSQAGMPIYVVKNNLEQLKEEIKKEIKEILIDTDHEGIILKADTLGSLEALINLIKERGISIKKASIGNINKKDVVAASSELNPLNKVIAGFNVKVVENDPSIKIINSNIIYKVIDDLEEYINKKSKNLKETELGEITKPYKVKVLRGCTFRQSNPCVMGVEVIAGKLKANTPIFKEGKKACTLKSIQKEKETVSEAKKGEQIAASFPGLIAGRQIKEGDILYSDIPEPEFRKLKKLKKYLSDDEVMVLKEIAEIKRKEKITWGI
jgi:translation initiation factor 5B